VFYLPNIESADKRACVKVSIGIIHKTKYVRCDNINDQNFPFILSNTAVTLKNYI